MERREMQQVPSDGPGRGNTLGQRSLGHWFEGCYQLAAEKQDLLCSTGSLGLVDAQLE